MMYCAQTLNFPQHGGNQNVQHPFLVEPIFPLHTVLSFMYAGMIAKWRGWLCLRHADFLLAQTGELNIFNKQQANHRNTQHPYRQPEQRMVAPDFNHNSVNRAGDNPADA